MSPPTIADRSPALQLRQARDAQIPPALCPPARDVPHDPSRFYRGCGLLTDKQVGIVELDATALAQAVAAGKYSALEVTEAFIVAAAVAHAGTNCLAWFAPDEARARATWLDAELKRTGRPVGPMHGVPVSVKDFLKVRGMPMTAGHISSACVAQEDADVVSIFRRAGAVFMCKTTQPQSIMHLETSSYIFGVTTNSHNRDLTSGGSSGGEGALLGCRGSPIGISTDAGGSTRNPAANNGLWGFKPTTKRVPGGGMVGLTDVSRVGGTAGPICHSRRDMELWLRTALGAAAWKEDITLMSLPWRPVDGAGCGMGFEGWSGQDNRLRVGVMRDDGVVRPVRPVRRAMDRMVATLEAAGGFELVDCPGRWFDEGWQLTSSLYYMDGGQKLRNALAAGDEPMRPLTEWILTHASELSREQVEAVGVFLFLTPALLLTDMQLVARRDTLRQRYYNYFNSLRLDVILSPAGPAPAQPLGTSKYWAYTSMWNLLDWPAAVFPTGLSVETGDDEGERLTARNDHERHLYDTYSATVAAGSPIGLQLIAPRWQDERLMAALGKVEQVLPLVG